MTDPIIVDSLTTAKKNLFKSIFNKSLNILYRSNDGNRNHWLLSIFCVCPSNKCTSSLRPGNY